jgi:sulfite oxidase
LELLSQSTVTPTDLFFVRNHGNVPQIDPATYCLTVEGAPRSLSLTLDELHQQFVNVVIEATLQCAGNRRQELMAYKPIPGELGWDEAAISNATWRGVRLRDVLRAAGMDRFDRALYVALDGFDQTERLNRTFNFGGSIPIDKALNPEVILAYEMNGAPLTALHGFPLRLVVPGYIGARSVKWLKRIIVQAAPSDNYFQAQAYRLFGPDVTPENVNWDAGLMLGELPINAVITSPQAGSQLPAGSIEVQGYAIAGGNRCVARVDLSADEGRSWITTDLEGDDRPWTWRLWHTRLNLAPGEHHLIVRAFDSAANSQPEDIRSVWNFKGYMNNAWHRVCVAVR